MLKEFKPSFIFLGKFLSIYFVGNILYGLFIESYHDKPDVITNWVTHQTSFVLNLSGAVTRAETNTHAPTVLLMKENQIILNVFEGCNGINVMIIFVAFIFAFGGPHKKMIWFIPLGVMVVHISNLIRLCLLYFTVLHYEHYFYFVHKYFFTAILYLVIFGLWTIWVIRFNNNKTSSHPPVKA